MGSYLTLGSRLRPAKKTPGLSAWHLTEEENRVKKNQKRNQELEKKPRRLTLSRETIQILHDPALFEVAGGFLGYTRDGQGGTVNCVEWGGCQDI